MDLSHLTLSFICMITLCVSNLTGCSECQLYKCYMILRPSGSDMPVFPWDLLISQSLLSFSSSSNDLLPLCRLHNGFFTLFFRSSSSRALNGQRQKNKKILRTITYDGSATSSHRKRKQELNSTETSCDRVER
jgi:hypothetical protein